MVEPQRQDAVTRLDQYKVGIDSACFTADQVRDMENLPSGELTALEICRIFEVPPELALSDTDLRRLMPSRFHRFQLDRL